MTVLTVTCIYFGADVSANAFICAGKDEILTPSLPRGKNQTGQSLFITGPQKTRKEASNSCVGMVTILKASSIFKIVQQQFAAAMRQVRLFRVQDGVQPNFYLKHFCTHQRANFTSSNQVVPPSLAEQSANRTFPRSTLEHVGPWWNEAIQSFQSSAECSQVPSRLSKCQKIHKHLEFFVCAKICIFDLH